MQFELLLIALFLGPALVGVGFIMGRMSKTDYISKRQQPLTNEEVWETYRRLIQAEGGEPNIKPQEEDKPDPVAERLSKQDDVINHSGVGIVYRPSTEELVKLNEPQQIKEAKAALEETFSQEEEPAI
jgi:hypothetical protein